MAGRGSTLRKRAASSDLHRSGGADLLSARAYLPARTGRDTRPLPIARASDTFYLLIKGVAEAALYCAHRTIYMLPPSSLVISLRDGG